MTISQEHKDRIAKIIRQAGGEPIVPRSLRQSKTGLKFKLPCDESAALKLCEALADRGLQHDSGYRVKVGEAKDGTPIIRPAKVFKITPYDGGCAVKWMIRADRDLFHGDLSE